MDSPDTPMPTQTQTPTPDPPRPPTGFHALPLGSPVDLDMNLGLAHNGSDPTLSGADGNGNGNGHESDIRDPGHDTASDTNSLADLDDDLDDDMDIDPPSPSSTAALHAFADTDSPLAALGIDSFALAGLGTDFQELVTGPAVSEPSRPTAIAASRTRMSVESSTTLDRIIQRESQQSALSYPLLIAPRAKFRLRPLNHDYRGRFFEGYSRRIPISLSGSAEDDQCDAFQRGKKVSMRTATRVHIQDSSSDSDSELALDEEAGVQSSALLIDPTHILPVNLTNWETMVMWDDNPHSPHSSLIALHDFDSSLLAQVRQAEHGNLQMSMLPSRNLLLDFDEWLDPLRFNTDKQPHLDVSLFHDPTLLIPLGSVARDNSASRTPVKALRRHHTDSDMNAVDRFNLSHDENYAVAKRPGAARDAHVVLQHAGPAIRLALAYYKPELTAKELRHLHRPQFFMEPNTEVSFVKTKSLKKKKVKGKENVELLRSARDMTLRDSSNFILLEYSDEVPLLLSNVGMAAFVYNYYRKRDEKDPTEPTAEIGATNILEPDQPGPFFGFVDIDKGQAMPVLYNNMIRAPLYPHKPNDTDFILIRQTHKGAVKYFLRAIPHQFVVGQIFPAMSLPPPTARVYTEYRRNRIRVGVYRLMRKKPNSARDGINYESLELMFPHYTEVALKARLKEFMESRGLKPNHWRLKGGAPPPSEEEIRKMVPPEQVCMFNTMEAANRHIDDLTYVTESNPKTLTGKSSMPNQEALFEEEMLPWKLTANFEHATKGKVQLKIKGEGDPTGPAEAGFSFIRAPKGDKFLRHLSHYVDDAGEIDEEVAYQRLIRDQWDRQRQSLSITTPSDEPMEQQLAKEERQILAKHATKGQLEGKDRAKAMAAVRSSLAPAIVPSLGKGSKSKSGQQNGGALPKVLVIRRRPKGMHTWQEELVTNPVIIENYLRHKQQLDTAGDGSSLDKFRKQKLVTGSRMFRENAIQEALRKSRPVQCRRCGQVGHIKTNREKCPAYNDSPEFKSLKRARGEAVGYDDEDETIFASAANTPLLGPAAKRAKRKLPTSELSEILDTILASVMNTQESKNFLQKKADSKYKEKVKDAIFLPAIADKNKELLYMSSHDFVNDIRRLYENTLTVYGADHGLTSAADRLKQHVVSEINRRHTRLTQLNAEIEAFNRTAAANRTGPRGRPGRKSQAAMAAAAVAPILAAASASRNSPAPMSAPQIVPNQSLAGSLPLAAYSAPPPRQQPRPQVLGRLTAARRLALFRLHRHITTCSSRSQYHQRRPCLALPHPRRSPCSPFHKRFPPPRHLCLHPRLRLVEVMQACGHPRRRRMMTQMWTLRIEAANVVLC
ncbi:hypothetical protein BCR44DRAFT_1097672 [Catenaria anguillulae PL171]|uniref:Bromo domain-containing protein n=1 Tax=Catenaria anguillulae PL171 TaxID=765915 RepID=A0A1Y2I3V0_9FUNG|nr:hypothetical protein BCR44DRAFT_1097672 [Catenaria anguillulae PL171]